MTKYLFRNQTAKQNKSIFKTLLWLCLLLSIISLSAYAFARLLGNESPAQQNNSVFLDTLFHSVYVDSEHNIPSWFNGTLWFLTALTAFIISYLAKISQKKQIQRNSLILGLVACLASLDEFMMVHERLGVILTHLKDYLPFDIFKIPVFWVVPGFFIALLVVGLLFKFIFYFPTNLRNNIFLAGILFLTATIVIETFSGIWVQRYGIDVYYTLIVHLEELLEMLAVSLAFSSLLRLIIFSKKENIISLSLLETF